MSLPDSIRQQVRVRAQHRCEYCHLPEGFTRFSHQVDHINPPRHLGTDDLNNLAWACFHCNNSKGTDIATVEAVLFKRVWLYQPRTQRWQQHFEMTPQGVIVGKTLSGRGTVRLLDMNRIQIIDLRRSLLQAGLIKVNVG
jgi:hypothetical protein